MERAQILKTLANLKPQDVIKFTTVSYEDKSCPVSNLRTLSTYGYSQYHAIDNTEYVVLATNFNIGKLTNLKDDKLEDEYNTYYNYDDFVTNGDDLSNDYNDENEHHPKRLRISDERMFYIDKANNNRFICVIPVNYQDALADTMITWVISCKDCMIRDSVYLRSESQISSIEVVLVEN
jgi:hypothetical protein